MSFRVIRALVIRINKQKQSSSSSKTRNESIIYLEIAYLPEWTVVAAYAPGYVRLAGTGRPLRHVYLEIQPATRETQRVYI